MRKVFRVSVSAIRRYTGGWSGGARNRRASASSASQIPARRWRRPPQLPRTTQPLNSSASSQGRSWFCPGLLGQAMTDNHPIWMRRIARPGLGDIRKAYRVSRRSSVRRSERSSCVG